MLSESPVQSYKEVCCREYKNKTLRLVMNSYANSDCTTVFCYISSKVHKKKSAILMNVPGV